MTDRQHAALAAFTRALAELPSTDGLMNPYASATGVAPNGAGEEIGATADRIRTHNLEAILTALLDAGSDLLFVGEAPSHLGARYSGYAFSSEREIAGGAFPFEDCQLLPEAARGRRPLREEPSALYLWRAMARRTVPAVFHNICPLHPHEPGKPTTNRKPTREEVGMGQASMQLLLDLLRPRMILAIGRTAERALDAMGVEATGVRHPSYGGAPLMFEQLEALGVIDPPPPPAQTTLL